MKDEAKPQPDSMALPALFPASPWNRSLKSKPFHQLEHEFTSGEMNFIAWPDKELKYVQDVQK